MLDAILRRAANSKKPLRTKSFVNTALEDLCIALLVYVFRTIDLLRFSTWFLENARNQKFSPDSCLSVLYALVFTTWHVWNLLTKFVLFLFYQHHLPGLRMDSLCSCLKYSDSSGALANNVCSYSSSQVALWHKFHLHIGYITSPLLSDGNCTNRYRPIGQNAVSNNIYFFQASARIPTAQI